MKSLRQFTETEEKMARLLDITRRSRTKRLSSVVSLLMFLFFVPESVPFCPVRTPSRFPSQNFNVPVYSSRLVGVPGTLSFVRNSSMLQAKKTSDQDDIDIDSDDEDDMPGDWNEDDILSEFDDVDISESEDQEDGDTDVEVDDDDEDEDDDDIDIEDLDLDDEDLDLDDEDEDDEDEEIEELDLVEAVGADYEGDPYAFPTGEEEDDEGGDIYYELEDVDDPNYMKQKELAEMAAEKALERAQDEAFDPIDFMLNEMTDEQHEIIQKSEVFQRIEQQLKGMELTEVDVGDVDLDQAVAEVPDLMADDPYPRLEDGESTILSAESKLSEDDLEEFDATFKMANAKVEEEPWDKVMYKDITAWDSLDNETISEMEDCLEEIGGSAYNVTKWLLYDLDFNVTNLILAAIKHNKEAPILFQHWYPQLVTYKRYQHARDRNFDFTWEDVERADMSELERYYVGFGYEEIPKKAPAETGIISLEDLDEDEIKMAAFENWMKEVYNPEWDRKDFDDDDMQDEDNVFSHFYEAPQHPDKPTFEDSLEDIELWNQEMDEEMGERGDVESIRNYRDMMGQAFEYEVEEDEEFQREFRGHLVIACTADDSDLEIAEKITMRFEKEFGKQVFVETRILELARQEDNVFEVWLESYEVDLLHSKKRASSNTKGWEGPEYCDDAQIEYLVDRVRFLISDEARYSYRMEDFEMAE